MKTIKFGKYQGVVEDDIFEQESFNLDTDSGDLVELSKHPDQDGQTVGLPVLIITNGMNGYGENIFEEIKDLEVTVIDGPFSEKVGESLEPLLEDDGLGDGQPEELSQEDIGERQAVIEQDKVGRDGEYIYFKMTKNSKTERVFFTGGSRTDEEINNSFEEKCGGVYEWIRASDVSPDHSEGEFEDEAN